MTGAFPTRRVGQTSLRLPVLGFGTAPLGGMFQAVDGTEGAATLAQALDAGMTYVDTAPFYGFGLSERRVGDGLRGQSHVLSTKVGRLLAPGMTPAAAAMGWPEPLPFHPVFDYSYDAIMRSFEASLHRLGLEKIDILYVPDIGEVTPGENAQKHFREMAQGGYRALDELRRAGHVTAIGLGVNEAQVCLDALNVGDWDIFLLAGRYTLLEQDPLDDLLPQCVERSISLVIGGPFNSGILVGGDTWNYDAAPDTVRAKVRRLEAVCGEYGVPLPAAALQFPLAHEAVTSVLPGLRNRQELADALAWAKHPIPPQLWQTLKDQGLLHPNAPTPPSSSSPYLSPAP